MGREGIEPLVATPSFFDTGVTIRFGGTRPALLRLIKNQFDQKYSEQDSNLQTLGLKPSRSTDGVPEQSSPGRIRTVDLLYVRQLPQPTRPQDFYSFQAEAVRLELTTPVRAHQFSKLAPHPAGWLPLTLNQPTQN